MRKLIGFLTLTLALLAAMPAAAQRDRSDERRWENRERVSMQGRIRSFSRERDGYRVYLDRGNYSYWVPLSVLGRRQLRVGMEIRFAGAYRGGSVWVDDIGWPSEVNDEFLSGRVERVNRFEQRLWLRDDRGRTIEIDARALGDERRRRLDLGDLHRGDRVTLRGRWDHGIFRAFRIESASPR